MCNHVLRRLKEKTERVLDSKTMDQLSRVRKRRDLPGDIKTMPPSLLVSIIKASNKKGKINLEILKGIMTYENPYEPGTLREISNNQFFNFCGMDTVISKKVMFELKGMEILDVEKLGGITKSRVSHKMEGLAKQLELEKKMSFLKI